MFETGVEHEAYRVRVHGSTDYKLPKPSYYLTKLRSFYGTTVSFINNFVFQLPFYFSGEKLVYDCK